MTGTEVGVTEFEEIFRAHVREVHDFLRRRVPSDAEDVTSEVFAIAWRRRRDLPEPELRRAWLYGVARRLVMSTARETSRRREAATGWAQLGPERRGEAAEGRDNVVERLVWALPDPDRELLVLVAWDGCTVAEAGRVLGIRPGTARVRLHRLRQRLARDPLMRVALEGRTLEELPDHERPTCSDGPTIDVPVRSGRTGRGPS